LNIYQNFQIWYIYRPIYIPVGITGLPRFSRCVRYKEQSPEMMQETGA